MPGIFPNAVAVLGVPFNNVTMEDLWDPGKPIYDSGPIELQNHGNTLYFRNIYVKELK